MSQVSENTSQEERRSDAQANRRALLNAAQEAFAESGPDVSMSGIARRAEVSRATLYRNFPDRETLAFAVLKKNVETLEERAEHLLEAEGADAFVDMLRLVALQQVEVQSLVPVLSASSEAKQISVLRARLTKLFEKPVRSAQEAGALRSDFAPDDILWVVDMLGAALRADDPDERRRQVERALELILHGLLNETV